MAAAKPKAPTKFQQRAARIVGRERFKRAHRAEKNYARQLMHIAKQVGIIVGGYAPKGVVTDLSAITATLNRYADLINPWAKAVSTRMLAEVNQRDQESWNSLGKELGRGLRAEIRSAPTGALFRSLLDEQTALITSLPKKASQRVSELVIKAMSSGTRADETAKEIMKTGKVTRSRAMLIARTTTTTASSSLVEARAQHIGSEGYLWRGSLDGDERKSHRKMEGKFIRWDSPPTLDGLTGHAGRLPNCRCWPEPVIPDIIR